MAKASIFIKIGYWGYVELEVIWNRQEYWYYWNNKLIIFVSSHFLWVLFLRCLVKYQSANTMLVFPLILFTTLTIIYSSIYSINLSLLNIGPPYIVYCHNRQNNLMHFIWILIKLFYCQVATTHLPLKGVAILGDTKNAWKQYYFFEYP